MLFSLLKHYLDTALKVSQSVYCFTTSISHGVENYFPRLWGTGISDAIFISTMLGMNILVFFLSASPFIAAHLQKQNFTYPSATFGVEAYWLDLMCLVLGNICQQLLSWQHLSFYYLSILCSYIQKPMHRF